MNSRENTDHGELNRWFTLYDLFNSDRGEVVYAKMLRVADCLGAREQARDIVQAILGNSLLKKMEFESEAAVTAYLTRAVRNQVNTVYRREFRSNHRESQLDDCQVYPSKAINDHELRLENSESASVFFDIVKSCLTESDFKLAFAFWVEGKRADDICEVTGITLGVFRNSIRRIRTFLKRVYQQSEGADD